MNISIFYYLNLNRIESIVFDLIRPFRIKTGGLIIRKIDIIAFINAGGIDAFGRIKDLNDR